MTSGGSKTRKKGEGRYPPNPLEWTNERNALGVRDKLHLGPLEPLSPLSAFMRLLPKVVLRPHGDIPCAQKYIDTFRGPIGTTWSALALPGDHGDILVIYNDSHSMRRIQATLMEEFFHVWLGHPPSKLRYYGDREQSHRTFNGEIEREAYGSGAASLLPYSGLKSCVLEGQSVAQIADHFNVSEELVRYRCKRTKLYSRIARPPAWSAKSTNLNKLPR